MRYVFFAALSAIISIFSPSVSAQPQYEGFTHVDSKYGDAFRLDIDSELLFVLRPVNGRSLQAAVTAAKDEMLANKDCLELSDEKPKSEMGGAMVYLEDMAPSSLCGVIAMANHEALVFVVGTNPQENKMRSDRAGFAAMALIGYYSQSPFAIKTGAAGQGGMRPSAITQSQLPSHKGQSGVAVIDSDLAKAIGQIPARNVPEYVMTVGRGTFSGYPPSYVYVVNLHLLFSNGYGTDCADWDPRVLDPTPQSLGRVREDCDVYRWRKTVSGGIDRYDEEDGWEELSENLRDEETVYGFRAGQRLNVEFGNVSASGFNPGVEGMVAVNSISYQGLRLTPDGRIMTDRKGGTVISGANVGGGSSYENVTLSGRYYLDRYFMAIATDAGPTIVTFNAGVDGDNGQLGYLYFQGELFWDDDD